MGNQKQKLGEKRSKKRKKQKQTKCF